MANWSTPTNGFTGTLQTRQTADARFVPAIILLKDTTPVRRPIVTKEAIPVPGAGETSKNHAIRPAAILALFAPSAGGGRTISAFAGPVVKLSSGKRMRLDLAAAGGTGDASRALFAA